MTDIPAPDPIVGRSATTRLDLPLGGHANVAAILAYESGVFHAGDAVSRELTRHGIAVLHLVPHGDAPSTDELIRASVTHLSERISAPFLLVGHGRAGAALLQAAKEWPSVRAIAAIGIPATAEWLEGMSKLGKALLILHAPTDEVATVEDARYAGSIIAAWARRYRPVGVVEPDGAGAGVPAGGSPHGTSAVARIGRDRFLTEIRAGGHAIVADEPESAEGTNLGPNPYELLLASLGSCTAITIRMYADRKGWPLEAVNVALHHEKVAPDLAGLDAAGPGKVDLIRIEVGLEGDLDAAQFARLMDVAEKCPVHKTLKSATILKTSPAPRTAADCPPLNS